MKYAMGHTKAGANLAWNWTTLRRGVQFTTLHVITSISLTCNKITKKITFIKSRIKLTQMFFISLDVTFSSKYSERPN